MIIKGTFIDTPTPNKYRVRKGYGIFINNKFKGIYENIPGEYKDEELFDYSKYLIIPGMSDLHLHAPQYSYRGTAMDVTLLDWLNKYTYPEEGKYVDIEYAKKGYSYFVRDLINTTTTRICAFATIHKDATLFLMSELDKAGFSGYVGKLNMNRNSPDFYIEESVEKGIKDTISWIESCSFKNIKPMITPRFTPSVTDDYMEELGKIARKYNLPMQSHLDENVDEINWVKNLCPNSLHYADTYDKYGLFGDVPTVMAHCIYCNEDENKIIKEKGVMIAHCPTSNENVIAGIAPSAYYLRNGYRIGLGSDVAGGHTLNLLAVMASAVQVSKLRTLMNKEYKPLSMVEAFFMATNLGGTFFGKVGLFEDDYDFDLVVIDDNDEGNPMEFSIEERIERIAYRENIKIVSKYSNGNKIL